MGGGDNIAGVDSSERDTVDLERTGNEENTLVEVVQEDDTLATESTSEKDKDGTRGERSARSGSSDGFANL